MKPINIASNLKKVPVLTKLESKEFSKKIFPSVNADKKYNKFLNKFSFLKNKINNGNIR